MAIDSGTTSALDEVGRFPAWAVRFGSDADHVARHFDGDAHKYRSRIKLTGFVRCDRVLYLGCKSVGSMPFLAESADKLTVSDSESMHLDQARRINELFHLDNIDYLQIADPPKLPFGESSFDGVWLEGEWLSKFGRAAVLEELRRVLIPRGRLYVAEGPGAGMAVAAAAGGASNMLDVVAQGPEYAGVGSFMTSSNLGALMRPHRFGVVQKVSPEVSWCGPSADAGTQSGLDFASIADNLRVRAAASGPDRAPYPVNGMERAISFVAIARRDKLDSTDEAKPEIGTAAVRRRKQTPVAEGHSTQADERAKKQIARRNRQIALAAAVVNSGDWPDQNLVLEKFLGERLGRRLRHESSEEIIQPKRAERKRRYFRHTFNIEDSGGETLSVFTKTNVSPAPQWQGLEEFLSDVPAPDFRVPRFFGIVDLGGGRREGRIGIWECVSGRSQPLRRCSQDELKRIVHAVGAMSVLTPPILDRVPAIQMGTRIPTDISERLLSTLAGLSIRGGTPAPLMEQVNAFARLENGARSHLQRLGDRFFSHMDIAQSGNRFFSDESSVPWIIDWDSSCVAPAGSGLRGFARLNDELQKRSAQWYVDYMEQNGVSLALKDVLFAIRATQVLHMVGGAMARGDVAVDDAGNLKQGHLHWGLAHVAYLEVD